MKNKEIINKILNSIGFAVFIGILLFCKTLLFYYSTIVVGDTLEAETIVGTICFIIIIICFLGVLPNRLRIITSIIMDFIISLLLFGDHIYYIFSNSVLSIAQISNLQYGEEITKTLPMVIQIKQILYFLDIFIILGVLFKRTLKIEKKKENTKNQIIGKILIGSVGIFIFIFIAITYIKMGTELSYNKDLQIRKSTIYGYHISDIANNITMKKRTKYKNYDDE